MSLRDQVDQAVRKAAVGALKRVPSPEDCGCGRRKRKMIENLRNGKSAGDIVREALSDLTSK